MNVRTSRAVLTAALWSLVAACAMALALCTSPYAAFADESDYTDGTYVIQGLETSTGMIIFDTDDSAGWVKIEGDNVQVIVDVYCPNKYDAAWKGMRDNAPEDPTNTPDIIYGTFVVDDGYDGPNVGNVFVDEENRIRGGAGVAYKAVRFVVPMTKSELADTVEGGAPVYWVMRRSAWSPSNPLKWMGDNNNYFTFSGLEKVEDGSGDAPAVDDEPEAPADVTMSLSVTNNVATIAAGDSASALVHGSAGDEDFSIMLDVPMTDSLYDKVVYPSVIDGAAAEAIATVGTGNKFTLSLINTADVTSFANGQPVATRWHRTDVDAWIDRTLTVDVNARTLVIDGKAVNIDIVEKLIAALPHDPYDIYGDADGSIANAQAAYEMLDAAEQVLLDNTLVNKDGKDISRSYGRYLEQAVWAVYSLRPVDDATQLADGTYTGKTTSTSSMGKSTSARSKKFSVVSVTVKDGHATALLEHDSDASASLRMGGVEYPNVNPDGKSRYEVSIDLNSTFYFSVKGKDATTDTDAITYEMTNKMDEAAAQPDPPASDEAGSDEEPGADDPGNESGDQPGEQSGNASGGSMSMEEVDKLVDGLLDYFEKQTDIKDVNSVINAIDSLPGIRDISEDDLVTIRTIRVAYESLSDDQKSRVANITRLEAAESALEVKLAVAKKAASQAEPAQPSGSQASSSTAAPAPGSALPTGTGAGAASGAGASQGTSGNASAASSTGDSKEAASSGTATTSRGTTNLPFNSTLTNTTASSSSTSSSNSANSTATGTTGSTATTAVSSSSSSASPKASATAAQTQVAGAAQAGQTDTATQASMSSEPHLSDFPYGKWLVLGAIALIAAGGALAFVLSFVKNDYLKY